MFPARRWGSLCLALAATSAASAGELKVVHMAPQGVVENLEQLRIRIVFSAPVVPLAQVQPHAEPPPWLTVTPAILARWRWAGTSELVGEPQAPLPRATSFTVRLAGGLTSTSGARLRREKVFTFETPRPLVAMAKDTGGAADTFAVVLTFDQPVDPASLAAHLAVRITPNRLDALDESLLEAQRQRLARNDPEVFAAWQRFVQECRGAPAAPAQYALKSDPARPHEVFRITPVGAWPTSAKITVTVAAGVRSLAGPLPSDQPVTAVFETPWPFGPVRFAGRSSDNGAGFDPESVRLVFSSEVTWSHLATHLSYREAGESDWHRITFPAEEGDWEWGDTELSLFPLGLEGGSRYEVCLDADAANTEGRRLGFPWCGSFATSHQTPAFYLVERDGVVEWEGPHLLPLRLLNVTAYRLAQRRLDEEELVGMLTDREGGTEGEGEFFSVQLSLPADRPALVPIDLDPPLGGRPGVILTRLQVESVVPGSEYDESEAEWLRKPRSSLTQVTSLGLTVKGSSYEGLLIWVTELKEPRPAPGVTITVRNANNGVLWRGTTDAQGFLRTPPSVSLEQAFVVTARRGDDLAYARTSWWEGHRGWEFNLPVDYPPPPAPPLLAHVWTDRGVVRPGDSLHLKAVLRQRGDRGLAPPPAGPFTFVVRGPDGGDALIAATSYEPSTGAEAEIRIPPSAPLGVYEVLVGDQYDRGRRAFAGGQVGGARCIFRVAEFRRPKFRVLASTEKDTLLAGDRLVAHAEGRLLAGGAMAGAPARWTVRARQVAWRPRGEHWANFETLPAAFRREDEPARTVVAFQSTALDETGRLGVVLPRVEAVQGWPARFDVEVEITDVDRQQAAATTAVTVLSGEFSLGVERPPFFLTAAEGVATRVVALTPDGTPRASVPVDVVLLRRHWESVRRREVSGRYVFESTPVVHEVARTQVVTAAEGVPVRFELGSGGEYALVVRGHDGRGNPIEASTAFYVFGAGFAAWRFDQENRIELIAERERVKPGDTVRILVKSPWERALALVTVEGAGVFEARLEELVGTMPTITVQVKPEYIPNVFVSAVLLRGRIEAPPDPELVDPGRPSYRVGYCELTVPANDKRLAVTVATGKGEYRPGQEATATVTVAGADGRPRRAAVTLWAVDTGVLSLTDYRTPDLMATFYARRGLGVTTAESRSRLVGRRSYGTKGDKPGGGGGIETTGEQVRRDFRALAFWEGFLLTDESGRTTVRFPLPDSLTTYRLMAVASAGEDEFGSGEREFLVTKPISLEPALPRFLRPGDTARAGVVVRNRTATEREIEITLSLPPQGSLSLRGSGTRVARVPAGGSAEVGFGLVAGPPGLASLIFAARSAEPVLETDTAAFSLPVLTLQPIETVATFFSTAAEAREEVAVPVDVFAGTGGLTIRLAPSALEEARGGIRFLATYPYNCSEQIASRVLGLAAALRLGEGFAPAVVDGLPARDWLAKTTAELADRQRSDGGFAFWPGGTSFEELSAYLVWALVEARRAGVAVDAKILDAAADYLSRRLRHTDRRWGKAHDWTARTLLSFALQRLGRGEPGYFQALFDRRISDGSGWGRALLAATMLEANRRDPRTKILLQELRNALEVEARTARLPDPSPEWGWWVFWSEPRGSAMALMALLAADPRDGVTERLARGLLDHLARGRHFTTHDTAWILHALAQYREQHEGRTARGSVEARLGGTPLLAGRFAGGAAASLSASLTMEELKRQATQGDKPLPLIVRFSGDGLVHGAAELSYASRRTDRPALEQGFALARRLLTADGRQLPRVAAGEDVFLEVTVASPTLRRFVAVDVPIPAGLEAVDPGLATTATTDRAVDEEGVLWQPGFDRVELRDDRVVLFATELPAGRHTHTVRCRATTAGSFAVAPGKVEAMYEPQLFGTTATETFEVTPTRR